MCGLGRHGVTAKVAGELEMRGDRSRRWRADWGHAGWGGVGIVGQWASDDRGAGDGRALRAGNTGVLTIWVVPTSGRTDTFSASAYLRRPDASEVGRCAGGVDAVDAVNDASNASACHRGGKRWVVICALQIVCADSAASARLRLIWPRAGCRKRGRCCRMGERHGGQKGEGKAQDGEQ